MVIFKLDQKKISEIAFLLSLEITKKDLKEAEKEIKDLKEKWKKNKKFLSSLFLKLFSKDLLEKEVKIFVFPKKFYLCAANPREFIILFGQPKVSEYSSIVTIVHELTHLYLSTVSLKRAPIVDEIICSLLENQVCLKLEKKNLKEVWEKQKLFPSHQIVLQLATTEGFQEMMKGKKNIKEMILEISSKIEKKYSNLTFSKGVITTYHTFKKFLDKT